MWRDGVQFFIGLLAFIVIVFILWSIVTILEIGWGYMEEHHQSIKTAIGAIMGIMLFLGASTALSYMIWTTGGAILHKWHWLGR